MRQGTWLGGRSGQVSDSDMARLDSMSKTELVRRLPNGGSWVYRAGPGGASISGFSYDEGQNIAEVETLDAYAQRLAASRAAEVRRVEAAQAETERQTQEAARRAEADRALRVQQEADALRRRQIATAEAQAVSRAGAAEAIVLKAPAVPGPPALLPPTSSAKPVSIPVLLVQPKKTVGLADAIADGNQRTGISMSAADRAKIAAMANPDVIVGGTDWIPYAAVGSLALLALMAFASAKS